MGHRRDRIDRRKKQQKETRLKNFRRKENQRARKQARTEARAKKMKAE